MERLQPAMVGVTALLAETGDDLGGHGEVGRVLKSRKGAEDTSKCGWMLHPGSLPRCFYTRCLPIMIGNVDGERGGGETEKGKGRDHVPSKRPEGFGEQVSLLTSSLTQHTHNLANRIQRKGRYLKHVIRQVPRKH
jgi:hypothetical protein